MFITENLSTFPISLSDPEPPKRFRVFRPGMNDTLKGQFLFDVEAANAVMIAWKRYGNDLVIDYDHASISPDSRVEDRKAAGWCSLQIEQTEAGPELWCDGVRWTQGAASAIAAKEWRYISPYFTFDPTTRRILSIFNVAITNNPGTCHLEPLVAANRIPGATETKTDTQEAKEEHMDELMKALGLSAGAKEVEALSVVNRLQAEAKRMQSDSERVMQMTGQTTLSAAVGTIEAWKVSHDELPALREKLTAIEKDARAQQVTTMLTKARDEHKLTKAMADSLQSKGVEDPVWLEAYLNALPVIPALENTQDTKGTAAAPAGPKWESLTSMQKHEMKYANPQLFDALREDYLKRKSA